MIRKAFVFLLAAAMLSCAAGCAWSESTSVSAGANNADLHRSGAFRYEEIFGLIKDGQILDDSVKTAVFLAPYLRENSEMMTQLLDALKEEPYRLGDRELSYTNCGTDVLELQTLLDAMGFFNGYKNAYFDTSTDFAVRSFQSYVGLQPDGIVGEDTLSELERMKSMIGPLDEGEDYIEFKNYLKEFDPKGKYDAYKFVLYEIFRYSNSIDRLKKLAAEKFYTLGERELDIGFAGTDVALLQELLHTLGYYGSDVDGSFGPRTGEALKRYQKAHNITDTGKFDYDTFRMVVSDVFLALGSMVDLNRLMEKY